MENDLEAQLEKFRVIPRKPGDPRFISILLGNNDFKERKYFHCVNCGYTLFHYYSEVELIIEGEIRDVSPVSRPIDIVCNRQKCKTVYRII